MSIVSFLAGFFVGALCMYIRHLLFALKVRRSLDELLTQVRDIKKVMKP